MKRSDQTADSLHSFSVGGQTITVVAEPLNKHKEWLRRIIDALEPTGATRATRSDYGVIVAYTVSVEGEGWKPPSPHSPAAELIEDFNHWLETGSGTVSEKWVDNINAAYTVARGSLDPNLKSVG